jgi:hypothetical protein
MEVRLKSSHTFSCQFLIIWNPAYLGFFLIRIEATEAKSPSCFLIRIESARAEPLGYLAYLLLSIKN